PAPTLYAGVRQTLLNIAASGELKSERVTLKAQIGRLPDPDPLQRVLRLLAAAPTIDLVLAVLVAVVSVVVNPWILLFEAAALPAALLLFHRSIATSAGREAGEDRSP